MNMEELKSELFQYTFLIFEKVAIYLSQELLLFFLTLKLDTVNWVELSLFFCKIIHVFGPIFESNLFTCPVKQASVVTR